MKGTTVLGLALIVLGVLALLYQGVSYRTREKFFELGPFKAEVERERSVPLPPVVGVVAIAGGIVLLLVGSRRS